jgi:hypothetical protein
MLMCGVSCVVERRRGGHVRKSVHIRLPEVMRKFKLTVGAVQVESSVTHSAFESAWFQPLSLCNLISWFQRLLSNGSTCTATPRR